MATFGEKTEESQNACEITDYLIKLEKARKITVFLNGDRNFFGAQMLVNRRQIRTWDAFLNASTEKTGVSSAVRVITTPVSGTKLDGLEDLKDKESYVAITRGQFKPIGYTTLFERHKQYLAENVHRTSSILKIRPVEHSRIQVPGKISQIPVHSIIISVFVNGKDFDAPFRIPLSQKVLRKWDLVMKVIGDHVKGMMGGPKALYTVDGSKVITHSCDLEPGGAYVIVGSEPGGFQHYCYGCQTRAKHPKKLPPIKKKRRRTKKIGEKEASGLDAPQSAGDEAICGDQEAQQDNKDLGPVATSQGDLPLGAILKEPDPSIEVSTLAKQSSDTPKSKSPVQRTASGKIEKVSSSRIAEKTPSVPLNSAEEQLNDDSLIPVVDKAEDSQIMEKVTKVVEQTSPLQATEMEEETEPEMEVEHEDEKESEIAQEIQMEKELVEGDQEKQKAHENEQEATSFEQEVARSSPTGLVSDTQPNSERDGENQKYNESSEHSATVQDDVNDISATNSEAVAQSTETTAVHSDGQVDQDVRYQKQADTYVQSAEDSDKSLTENKDEPVVDGNTNESFDDDKALSKISTGADEVQKVRSESDSFDDVKAMFATNADVKEEPKDHNERDSFDDVKALSKTVTDVKEEQKDRSESDSFDDVKAMFARNTDVEEERKDRSESDSFDDVKAMFARNTDVEEERKDRSESDSFDDVKAMFATNTDVEEERKDHNERDSAATAMDAKVSDASERIERISSDVLVHAGSNKISTSGSKSEAPLARDPSDLHATQKSASKPDIQPHR